MTLPVLVLPRGARRATPAGARRARPPAGGPRAAGSRCSPAARVAAAVIALAALPAMAEDLTDEALTQAARGTPEDLREAAREGGPREAPQPVRGRSAVCPGLGPGARQPTGRRRAGVLVEAVERQPDNPARRRRLARFQVLPTTRPAHCARCSRWPHSLELRAAFGDVRRRCAASTTSAGPPAPPARRCPRRSGAGAGAEARPSRDAGRARRAGHADRRRRRPTPTPGAGTARSHAGAASGAAARQPAGEPFRLEG